MEIDIKKSFYSFHKDTRGNIALLSAFMIPVAVLAAGGAVDFSILYTNRMNLERAADAAVTASVSNIRRNAESLTQDEIPELMKETVESVFNSEVAVSGLNATVDFDVDVEYENQILIAKVTYSYGQDTSFLSLIGLDTLSAEGGATAKTSLGSYTDFNIMVNVSNSMGIGASPKDIEFMTANYKHDGKSCAFACHSTIDEVRKLPVKIRLDSANEAIQIALDTVEIDLHPDSVVRFGLYTYATWFTKIFDTANPDSANLDWVGKEVTENIQLTKEDNSRTDYALGELAKELGNSGNGSSQSNPRKYALIITDGIQWIRPRYPEYDKSVPGGANEWWARAQIPNRDACNALKEQGITVYFVYTTYYPAYNNTSTDSIFEDIEKYALPVNKDAMKACASDEDKFFEADDADKLTAAVETIFKEVVIPTHLSM